MNGRSSAFINDLNRDYAAKFPDHSELSARLTSYELAYRMQAEAPGAVDLTSETDASKMLYGMDRPETAEMGRLCLLSRRMVERGVRFVQIYHPLATNFPALTYPILTACFLSNRRMSPCVRDSSALGSMRTVSFRRMDLPSRRRRRSALDLAVAKQS